MMSVDLSETSNQSFKPNLFMVHKILDEEIVGEFESRMSLFTSWILGESNILMSGPRSSGKTFITDHLKELIGDFEEDDGRCLTLTAGSDKSVWYEMDKLNKADYVIVLELNKIPKEAQETLKDWGEGKSSKYKCVILEGGFRKNKVYTLDPKPFVFCLADEEEMKIGEQLMSRLTCIRTDATITQNKAILKQQARLAQEPKNVKSVDKKLISDIKEHIRTMPPMKKYSFKHPASELFTNSIPAFFTDCRRDFPKYISNVNGICRFHWKERMIDKESGVIFITPQDMYINHVVYSGILVESALKVNNVEREIIYALKRVGDFMDRNQIQKELRRGGMNISAHMVTKHLNQLSDLGYLHKDTNHKQKKALYEAGEFFNEFHFTINWKDVIKTCVKNMKEHYPESVVEYKSRFCDNPLVNDPFTGDVVDMSKLKEASIEPSKDKLTSFVNKNDEKIEEEVSVTDAMSSHQGTVMEEVIE